MLEKGLVDAIKFYEMGQAGVLALIGGVANYFYYLEKKGMTFRLASFLTNAVLSFFIGMVLGDLLPESEHKHGLFMVSGFCCYPILGYIETRVKKYLDKDLEKK